MTELFRKESNVKSDNNNKTAQWLTVEACNHCINNHRCFGVIIMENIRGNLDRDVT